MAASGLEGIVVAQTVLSEVDGEAGRLILRGQAVEQLAGRVPFEEVARRLWRGLAPGDAGAGGDLHAALGRARTAAFAGVAELRGLAARLAPVAALRLGLASLQADPARPEDDHLLVTAAMPVYVAAFDRARRGLPPVAPQPGLGQAADFLRMLRAGPARPEEVAALDAYLVTIAEHGMNASTFTARIVASTGAGVVPAVIAALSALAGPLHGGAPGPVLDMLDQLDGETDVRAWLAGELAAGRRLMGFGHRIYRVRDPRASVLKAQVARLRAGRAAPLPPDGPATGQRPGTGRPAGGQDRLALAERVEREALAALAELRPGRRLDTNVEFYTAVLLDALGIDRSLFTSVFAIGRVAGWTAHVFEQERTRRLIRPQSEYVGPRPELAPA
jgi:citrate synthase